MSFTDQASESLTPQQVQQMQQFELQTRKLAESKQQQNKF